MEILLKRKVRTAKSTTGDFIVNGNRIAYSLEDIDRRLQQSDSLDHIKSVKVHSETAIPAGRYEVILSFSNRFKKFLPLLLSVPGFEGIRIHSGNKADDSDGCILIGETVAADWVGSSRDAMAEFMSIFEPASKKGKIFITIA